MYWYNVGKHHRPVAKRLNFSTDGCSVKKIPKVLHARYDKAFYNACRIHDFGYRNFSKAKYKVTVGKHKSNERLSVDNRFYSNMKHVCATKPPSVRLLPDKKTCDTAAYGYYRAVRNQGWKYWH